MCKTSRRFMKNNTSFYEKQHVVLCKTSRCFVMNNVLMKELFGFLCNESRGVVYKSPTA